MSTRRVVIDDADSRIQYSGSWFTQAGRDSLGNDGPTYLGSQHGLKGKGGFTFTFEGTSIELYGTNGQVPSSDAYDPKWGCHIDGQPISGRSGSSEATNNWPLCATDGLSAGTHQLVVDVEGSGSGTFWFDRLMYTPSSSLPSGTVMWVDATRDSAFQYDNTWHSSGVMVTAVHGGSVSFSFTGSGLTWVGEIPDHSEMSSASLTYTIDGGHSATVNMAGKATENSPTQRNHVLFSTPDFSSGSHTIRVTYNGNSNTPLTAGYVYVRDKATRSASSSPSSSGSNPSSNSGQSSDSQSQDSSSVVVSDTSSSSSSPSPASSTSSPSLNSLSNSTSSNSSSSNSLVISSSSGSVSQLILPTSGGSGNSAATPPASQASPSGAHKTNPWVIIAAVFGGIVLILLILLLFFIRRRNRRKLSKLAPVGDLTPVPFTGGTPPNYTYNDSMVKLLPSPIHVDTQLDESAVSDMSTAGYPTEIKTPSGLTGRPRDAIVSLGAPPSYTQ